MDGVPTASGEILKHPELKQRTRLTVGSIIAALIIGGLAVFILARLDHRRPPNSLPSSVVSQVKAFDPYYFNPTFTTDFKLEPDTISYNSGILVFSMKNAVGKTLAFTEERTPPHFDPSSLTTSSQYNTQYGRELITNDSDRTVGTLFSADNTWVIVNAPNPIGATTMRQIVEALAPLRPQN